MNCTEDFDTVHLTTVIPIPHRDKDSFNTTRSESLNNRGGSLVVKVLSPSNNLRDKL